MMKNPIEPIIHWATISPENVAIQNTVSQFKYSELLDRIYRIAGEFKRLGIKPQQTVLLAMNEEHFRWIFSLALLHVGAKLIGRTDLADIDTLSSLHFDWAISDKESPNTPKDKLITIDRPWLANVRNMPLDLDYYHYQPSDIICFFQTSGTTGVKKNVAWNIQHLELRAKHEKYNTGENRKITLMPSTSNLGFYIGFSSFIFGQTLFTQGSNDEVIELIGNFGLEVIHGSVAQIASFTKTVVEKNDPNFFGKLKQIITAGSVIPLLVLDNIKQNLTKNVYSDYGSTETGFACRNSILNAEDIDSIGCPVPEVIVEIVDEFDNQLSENQEGKVRIKTPYMVNSYFENPNDTKIFFKDGWFYSGDKGYFNQANKLVITGRNSEVINLGGVKINYFLLDMFFLKYPGIKDAAVFTYVNATGVEELAVAIVSDNQIDIPILQQKLIREFGSTSSSPSRFFRANSIPRNPNGKVMRSELSEDLSKADEAN
jgi:long-chain acyl-CoA synthetase